MLCCEICFVLAPYPSHFSLPFCFYISLQVIRGGQRIKVSIFEMVVGDVVPLKIGDQVDGNVNCTCFMEKIIGEKYF